MRIWNELYCEKISPDSNKANQFVINKANKIESLKFIIQNWIQVIEAGNKANHIYSKQKPTTSSSSGEIPSCGIAGYTCTSGEPAVA